MSADAPITKQNLDAYLKEVAKRFRKLNGKNTPAEAQTMIQGILAVKDLDELYESYVREEQVAKESLLEFEEEYPDVLKEDNLSDILSHLLARQESLEKDKNEECPEP